jgi:4-cresol dehydrogenase (hydroxylating)
MSQAAIARWRALIGEAHVSTDEPALERAATATFPTAARVAAVLRPADTAEVAGCVRIAHELSVPLHPVSRGRNWGYGSRVPPRDAVVLELGRLDRIVDFDEHLAYVTVEPGVTFRALARYLRSCRARVFASVTGGTGEGSVIGNALERGDGAGPLGDRFGHACGLEVVLPTGEIVHTGFARFPGATVAPLARWGVGPSLDGLFSQSGLGVVTKMTVWLAPYPAAFLLGAFTIEGDARLPALVDALRRLKLAGVTPATVPLWNDYKALSLLGQYPWDEAGGVTPLPDAVRLAWRARAGLGRWNGTISLYGASRPHALALRDVALDALGGIASTLAFHEGPADPLDADEDSLGPALGVPHERSAAAVYWRKRTPAPSTLDPDADGCGFLWLGHAVPFEGGHARAVAALVEAELLRDGFEPSLALLGVGDRALSAVAAIAYDRALPGEDARALACHDRVHAALVARGYPPFRRGVQSPPDRSGEPASAALLETIAAALDPRGVFTRR